MNIDYCLLKNQTKSVTDKVLLILSGLAILSFLIVGCGEKPEQQFSSTITRQHPTPQGTYTSSPTSSTSTLPVAEEVVTTTIEPSLPSYPPECRAPSNNYDRIEVNGHLLNQRTFEMLQYADALFTGSLQITGNAITQGSYTSAVPESFGTHAGGGAVDLSVMSPGTYEIQHDQIEPLIRALRLAGFAAWFRDFDALYPGSPVHIHAIAIGDRELSLAAREQLAGPHGYFWGYDGLPVDDELPARDPHGGPIMCEWMIEMGYPNKTATPSP